MSVRFWVFALLCVSSITQAAERDDVRKTAVDEHGNETHWYVSEERFLKTPAWEFDPRGQPPLTMQDAHQRAYAWLAKAFPKVSSFKLNRYTLSTTGSPASPNRWYYTFDFVGSISGSAVRNSRFSVMVLMDGSVVEPRNAK